MTSDSIFALIDSNDELTVRAPLEGMGLMRPGDSISDVCVAGEGNMNCVLRVTIADQSKTTVRSVILKQSRPWVAKYPTIEAPAERILAEERFFQLASACAGVALRLPLVLGLVPEQYLMVLEDLGELQDETRRYHSLDWQSIPTAELVSWLLELHSIEVEGEDPGIHSLRKLNYHHMFTIPMVDPAALDLEQVCPGLSESTVRLRTDSELVEQMQKLGKRYLSSPKGSTRSLLHGDFYPGSWVQTSKGIRVIDAEFCYFGEPEFDVAVLIAHLVLAGANADEARAVAQSYSDQSCSSIDLQLVERWAGCELIRRILGVAQLPLHESLEHRLNCLSVADSFLRCRS